MARGEQSRPESGSMLTVPLRAARQRTLEAHGIDPRGRSCIRGSSAMPPFRRAAGAAGLQLRPSDPQRSTATWLPVRELGERPGGQSRRPDGVRTSRCAEREDDGELVGAGQSSCVPVIPRPPRSRRSRSSITQPSPTREALARRVTALAAQRDPRAVPRPEGSGGDVFGCGEAGAGRGSLVFKGAATRTRVRT